MSLFQSEALPLRTYPYAESAKIVVFLTRQRGQMRAMAYGARKARSSFGSALELLTHVRISLDVRENRELAILKECEIVRSYWPVIENRLEGSFYFHYFSELLAEFSQADERHEEVFRLVLAVLDHFDQVAADILARYFETWLLKLEGFWPDVGACSRCARPLSQSGGRLQSEGSGFVCRRCGGGSGTLITAEAFQAIETILSAHPRQLAGVRWPTAVRRSIEALNLRLLQYHLEKPLKSYRFIAEL